MVAVPVLKPGTAPVALFAVMSVLPVLHVPPDTLSLRFITEPVHTPPSPVIMAGIRFTVTVLYVVQPVLKLYSIVSIPADPAITIPVEPIVATIILLLLHMPPDTLSTNDIDVPAQVADTVPVITAGEANIVMCTVVVSDAHPSVTRTRKESMPVKPGDAV